MYDDHEFITAVETAVAKRRDSYSTAEELLERIASFTLESDTFWRNHFIEHDTKEDGTRYGMYGEGDESAPFFSEAFLYNLVGKDEARSILGMVRQALVLAGIPADRVHQKV